MTPSRLLFFFCISFVGGIFFASFFDLSEAYLLTLLIFCLSLVSVFWRNKKIVVLSFSMAFLTLGFWRCQSEEEKAGIAFNGSAGEVVVVSAPDIRETSQRLTVEGDFPGRALLFVPRYPEYEYGDRLKVDGEVEKPDLLEDFNYPGYLAKDGIYFISYNPEIEFVSKDNGNSFVSFILKIKEKMKEAIIKNLPQGHAALLSAMVLGDRAKLPDGLADDLNLSGVRHMTSISGMHVSIITTILMSFLLGMGLWRKQAFWITLIFIVLFISFTGLQAPAIRSGIMGICFLVSRQMGKQNFSLRTIVLSAGLMLAINPLLLLFDIGFQLSFLALLGILLCVPIFEKWLFMIPDKFQLREITAMSFAAQVFTLPILVFNFGQFSLVAPLANIFIVPVLPHIMILGFIFVLAGSFFPPLGFLFSLPCLFILHYLILAAGLFAELPFSAVFFNFPAALLAVYYVFLFAGVMFLTKKLKKSYV